MKFVAFMIFLFLCMDVIVWILFDRHLRAPGRPKILRKIFGIYMAAIIAFMLLTLVAFRYSAWLHEVVPRFIPATIYIWHFLILPATLIAIGIRAGTLKIVRKIRPQLLPAQPSLSRRNFLTATAMALPPLATFSTTTLALSQIGDFRVRRFDLPLPTLPRELDGLTLAVVADVHTGVFSTPKMLKDIADATNNLRADLILLPGDLLNISHSDLPQALDMVMKLDAPHGVWMVQGNHDVIEGAADFDAACQARGVNLLLDSLQTLRPRGIPIQLLGTRWQQRNPDMINSINTVADARDPGLFSILMAHHPHSWDQATVRGIPLTIAGHTHGGQIMLTKNLGAGPIRFKYWSGLYQQPGSNLIVSNGVGNWFPLRINAPAEILHITLRAASSNA